MATIRTRGYCPRSIFMSSSPWILGMMMSVTTMSGGCRSRTLKAPSAVLVTSTTKPARSRTLWIASPTSNSSSTTKIAAMSGTSVRRRGLARVREVNTKHCTAADSGVYRDGAPHRRHYPMNYRKPQPRTLPYTACSKERLEDVGDDGLIHPMPGVTDLQQRVFTRVEVRGLRI